MFIAKPRDSRSRVIDEADAEALSHGKLHPLHKPSPKRSSYVALTHSRCRAIEATTYPTSKKSSVVTIPAVEPMTK